MELYLIFHGIGEPDGNIAAAERPYWIDQTLFTTLIAEVGSKAKAAGVDVVATFDDGNLSDIEIAAPALSRHGVGAIFFPCSGRIGRDGYLAAGDLRSLRASGFEIGSHGVDHLPWRGLPQPQLQHEIRDSRIALEDLLGAPVVSAALPFGSYDAAALAMLRTSGYRTVYSSDRGLAASGEWFRRRWSYHRDRPFDIGSMVSWSRSPGNRILSGLKHAIKSRR